MGGGMSRLLWFELSLIIHLKLLWQPPSAQWVSHGSSQMDSNLFRFNHVGEFKRSLMKLLKYILHTLIQPFYFCDWACRCLVSARAAPITGEVQVRRQGWGAGGSTETRDRDCAPKGRQVEEAGGSISPLLEEMSHNQGQHDEEAKCLLRCYICSLSLQKSIFCNWD